MAQVGLRLAAFTIPFFFPTKIRESPDATSIMLHPEEKFMGICSKMGRTGDHYVTKKKALCGKTNTDCFLSHVGVTNIVPVSSE